MKKLSIFTFYFLLSAIIFPLGNAIAQKDFFDSISFGVNGQGQNKTIDARIYGALATSAWGDINQNGKLDQNELLSAPVRIYDRHGNLAVVSPNGLNRTQLQDWAIANSRAILAAIFPGGLSESTGQSEDNIMAGLSLSGILQKAKPAKNKSDTQGLIINNEFKGALEYLSVDVNNEKGDAASIFLGYNHTFGNSLELSLNLPYRYTTMDDEINSKSHFVALSLSGKYPVMSWWDSLVWDVGMDIFGSAFYLTSDAIDHAGNLKYGAGVFTAVTKKFNFGTLSIGTDFRISDASAPSSWVSTNDEFVEEIVDYINDLDAVKTLSYGFNLGIPFFNDMAAVNLEVIRSNFFSSDIESERDSQTTVGLTFSYYPTKSFELSLGVRQTFELQDIDIFGVYFGAIYRY